MGIHEQAATIRGMTDERIAQYIDQVRHNADNEGYNRGRKETDGYAVREFVESCASVPGIGAATVMKMTQVARSKGYVSE